MVSDTIKSKDRVDEFGEVFTPKHIVNDMLDLVRDKSYDIDTTFLEPACGNGNFLVEILSRKLETSKKDLNNFNINVIRSLCSIYAVDIQWDNVEESKARMLAIIKDDYENTGKVINNNLLKAFVYILDKNIIWGDTLSAKVIGDIHTGEKYEYNEKQIDNRPELKFTEWVLEGNLLKMTEYTLQEILYESNNAKEPYEQLVLDDELFKKSSKVEHIDDLYKYILDDRIEKLESIYEQYIESMKNAVKAKKDNKNSMVNKNKKVIKAW